MIKVRLLIGQQIGFVILDRLPGPEKVSSTTGVPLGHDNSRVRLPGPEKVAASGVAGRGFRFFRFPGPEKVSVAAGALFDIGVLLLVVETASGSGRL